MAYRTLKKEDLDALLIGLGILGTGGGGDPEWGRKIIENDFSKSRVYKIVDPEDVEDDAFICSGGIMGSVKALENISYDDIVSNWEEEFVLIKAFREMEKIKGRKLDYIVAFEPGGLNTPVIMSLAARMGIPIVNGDAVGRSAPETQMTSFIGHGISLNPMPLVDNNGNTIVVMNANETTYADEIGRTVVTKGGGMGGNAHYAMTGKQLKESCIPYTITRCIAIGNAIIEANEKGADPVATFKELEDGEIIFKGVLEDVEGEDKGGFYLTNIEVKGVDDYKGSLAKIVVKNETMAVWVDGKIRSIFPDLACILYTDTGKGIMSVDLKPGIHVSIVGMKCHERLRACMKTEIGRKALGGSRYGYPELEYVPIEDLIK
ncbi:MAG TPA: DUF917 domain-containing protein [Anaerovoracaceae bacterium]|nr:DUF917 domain-containing protein [Anaerovoracaceae bacterium]